MIVRIVDQATVNFASDCSWRGKEITIMHYHVDDLSPRSSQANTRSLEVRTVLRVVGWLTRGVSMEHFKISVHGVRTIDKKVVTSHDNQGTCGMSNRCCA